MTMFWTVANPHPAYAVHATSDSVLYLEIGKYRVVDGSFCKGGKNDLVAREVLLTGRAEIDVRGHVEVLACEASSVTARDRCVVTAMDDSRVEGEGVEIHVSMRSYVIARGTTVVHLHQAHDIPRVDAYDESLIIVHCEYPDLSRIRLHGRAQIVQSLQTFWRDNPRYPRLDGKPETKAAPAKRPHKAARAKAA